MRAQNQRLRTGHDRLVWTALLCLLATLAGCGGSKALATRVDDLLRAGKVAEANRTLAAELPTLVQAGKIQEADDVARVVGQATDNLSKADADSIYQRSVRSYFEGISSRLSDVPIEVVCDVVVTVQVPLSTDASLEEVSEYIQQQDRRESAAAYCQLLGSGF